MTQDDFPVILLAAGRGTRLGHLTEEIPKCMLPIKGSTIIRRQIEQIKDAGLGRIYVVSGYKSDILERHLSSYDVEFIHNPIWDRTNNIYSLHLARSVAEDGFYLMNSDVIIHPDILRKFVSTQGTAMVVDDFKDLGEEEMKVTIHNGRITDIGKDIPPSMADGEYIGIMRFISPDSRVLFDEIYAYVSRSETGVWYENAIRTILNRVSITPVSTGGLDWIEVDTPEDYEEIRSLSL